MKVLLGMSGGLDSAYALKMLLDAGHTVEGAVLVMHPYTETDLAGECADSFGIPLHVIDCREAFNSCVIPNFINEYRSGRTPNPCVICNSEVKFRCLYDYAMANGFDMIATGHYADVVRLEDTRGVRYAVRRALDTRKDQTYVLWRLSQDILSHVIFPLYNNKKESVREDARRLGIPAADREESQEICFIPDNDYVSYIENAVGSSPEGRFIDTEGNTLGTHRGIINYTVGQRKGLGIALGQRMFVTEINPTDNTVTLSAEDKTRDELCVSGMVFSGIAEPSVGEQITLSVKLRYLAKQEKCVLKYDGQGRARVSLFAPVRAVTPGQSAVFYNGDILAAGGFIE